MRVSGESLVLATTIPGRLNFDRLTSGSVVIRSSYQANDPNGIVYQEGIDYSVDYPNGTIARTMSSRIPDFSTNVLYGQHDFDQKNFPGYTNHPFYVWVDYATSNGEDFAKPNDQTPYLANARTKLEAGGTFRIISYGDSITAGREAATTASRFTTLYRSHLQSRFPGSTIVVEDVSKPSYTFIQAIASWDTTVGVTSPDLVLLGWRMNDHNLGGATPEQFKQNLMTLVGMVRNLKHAEVILFSAFPRWSMVLQRKDQPSLLGNNINHPNDFGHWMYLQAFAAMGF